MPDKLVAQEQRKQGPRPGKRVAHDGHHLVVIETAVEEATGACLVVFEVEETVECYLCLLEQWPAPKLGVTCDIDRWAYRPLKASRWSHYKGNGTYQVVSNGFHTDSGQHYVVYKSEQHGYVWAREIHDWEAFVTVGRKEVPRFSRISTERP